MIARLAVSSDRPDASFRDLLPLIRAAATDERNEVKKAVNWALRQIGKRNLALHAAAIERPRRCSTSTIEPPAGSPETRCASCAIRGPSHRISR